MMDTAAGRTALAAWEADDDAEFGRDTVLLGEADDPAPRPRLRVVVNRKIGDGGDGAAAT
jgi:hypothetical protein